MTLPLPNLQQLVVFLMLFTRVLGVFVSAPIFGARAIPSRVKIMFTIILAYIFYSLFVGSESFNFQEFTYLNVLMILINELLLGILIGFISLLIFGIVQFCGSIIDVMSGMHMASILDPLTREQQSLLGQFQYILTILLFLVFDGHHYIIHALYYSFKIIPLGAITFLKFSPEAFLKVFSNIFLVGLQLSAPVIAILFLIDFSLGVIAKGVPQMNVFMTGAPLKGLVAFISLFICLIYFGAFFNKIPKLTFDNIIYVLRSL